MMNKFSPALALLCLALANPSTSTAQFCTGDCDASERVTVAELVRSVRLALGESIPSTCLAADRNLDDSVSIDELMLSVNNSLFGCSGQTIAFATAIAPDFSRGGFAAADIEDREPLFPAGLDTPATTDSVPRVAGGIVLVINRFGGDSITARDPKNDFEIIWECSTGAGSNPQDIAVVDANKAYVSLYGGADLLIVDPSPSADCSDFEVDRIDLSSLADSDGVPEMTQMALVDGELYVALQELTNFVPSGPGAIAVIDTDTDTILDSFALRAMNPFGAAKGLLVRDGGLYISQIGNFGENDGGVERIDLESGNSDGLIVTEQTLGGDLNDFVLFSDRIAYAVIGLPDFTTTLVQFDPSSGALRQTIIAAGASITDIEINDRGQLYVADRAAAGLRVFNASDGTEITTSAIATGLPPFEVIFLR